MEGHDFVFGTDPDLRKITQDQLAQFAPNSSASDQAADTSILVAPSDSVEILVVGTNELGKHGGGAARYALDNLGAIWGQGFGPQGQTFGIPTVSAPTGDGNVKIHPKRLKYYVECFLLYARGCPNKKFKVTQIGCGLAGWVAAEVAPMFEHAPANCRFDEVWRPFLGDSHSYWGTG